MRAAALLVLAFNLSACLVRAPTSYELDRRAGFRVPTDEVAAARARSVSDLRTSSAVAPSPHTPVKVPPLIEKVWVSDLALADDCRMQGTWLFVEVERGRWLDEFDPGGGPLVAPAPSQKQGPTGAKLAPPPAVVEALKHAQQQQSE
jgi:hypothetical protein